MRIFSKNKSSNKLISNIQRFDKPVSRITGIGSYLPESIKTNKEIIQPLDIQGKLKDILPDLIEKTVKMKTRHCADPGSYPSDLATLSVLDALNSSGIEKERIDTLIFASTDTDQLEPATANVLQHKLGIKQTNAFDVSNACNSFLQALNVGNSLIATGASKCVAICAAELGTHWVCQNINGKEELRYKMGALTLGDASAAVILEPSNLSTSGISEINLFSLGEHWHLCHVPDDIHWRKKEKKNIHGWFYLDMGELARIVRPLTIDYFNQYKEYRKGEYNEIDIFNLIDMIVPHQISKRLIEEIGKVLDVNMKKLAITADIFGNTASAAIPLTLHHNIKNGSFELGSGQDVLLFGAASGLGMGHVRVRL